MIEWIVGVPVGLAVIYLVARFVFAAYFQSKKDFLDNERKKHHGPQ